MVDGCSLNSDLVISNRISDPFSAPREKNKKKKLRTMMKMTREDMFFFFLKKFTLNDPSDRPIP